MSESSKSDAQRRRGAYPQNLEQESQPPPADQFPYVQSEDGRPLPIATTSEDQLSTEIRNRGEFGSSTFVGRLRSASKKFEEASLPKGFFDATASAASKAPSLADIRRGSFGSDGWSVDGQTKERERRLSLVRQRSSQTGEERSPGSKVHHESLPEDLNEKQQKQLNMSSPVIEPQRDRGHNFTTSSIDTGATPTLSAGVEKTIPRTTPFDNGYQFPPQHTWTESTLIGLTAFWKFATTPLGFLITIYGLNVVAWGGMIFLLLCNASPAMCHPTCNNINSPRRKWIEYDSQILTALFCVTGFGLIPWRFRDLYYLLRFRIMKDPAGLRRLAGIHRDWFRLEGSQDLPVSLGPENIEAEHGNYPEMTVPFPLNKISEPPLTGIRAPPTPTWRLDYVIWMFVWNTLLQAVLSGLMWGLNRYNRPSWSTGLFVGLACIVAALGGIEIFAQGKKVKAAEGVPVPDKDLERLKQDKESGRSNINTLSGKVPKQEKEKPQQKASGTKKRASERVGENETASPELSV